MKGKCWSLVALLVATPAMAQQAGPPPPPPPGGQAGYPVPPVVVLLDWRGEPVEPPPLAPPPLPEVRSGRRDATPGATVTTTTAVTGSRTRAADDGTTTMTTDIYADPLPPRRPRRAVSGRRR